MEPHTQDPRCDASPDPRPETGAPNLENDAAKPHPSPDPRPPITDPLLSPRRLAANRANAAKSTGPITPEGKARSAQNSRKHGFTASTFAVVRLEELDETANLRQDLIDFYH